MAKIDMKALAKQQAERRNSLRATEEAIKSDEPVKAPVSATVPDSDNAVQEVSTRGRKPKYSKENPRHNMTLALTEEAWMKIKIVAVKRKTTPSALILDFINGLKE